MPLSVDLLAQCSIDILVQVVVLNTALTNCDMRQAPTRIDCYFTCYEDTACRMFSYNPTLAQCCMVAGANVAQETTSSEPGTHVYKVDKVYVTATDPPVTADPPVTTDPPVTADPPVTTDPPVTDDPPVTTGCLESFTYSSTASLCFKVLTGFLSWDAARLDCESRGASLIKIDSSLKHDAIRQYLDADALLKFQKYHIGGNKNNPDSAWRWLDGSDVAEVYNGWKPRRPLNFGGGNCLGLDIGGILTNHDWTDDYCISVYGHVCEIVQ